MLSCGIFSAFAAKTAVRSRALVSGLPPPFAATAISLSRRVKILPRLASSAPFLCLIVAHFECPDITTSAELKMAVLTHTRSVSIPLARVDLPGRSHRLKGFQSAAKSARPAANFNIIQTQSQRDGPARTEYRTQIELPASVDQPYPAYNQDCRVD